MVRKTHQVLVVAALIALGGFGSGTSRAQSLPPAPVPVTLGSPSSPNDPPNPDSPPAATAIPLQITLPAELISPAPPSSVPIHVGAPPACAPYEDCNGPLLQGDPLLDRPCWAPPGWFVAFEVGILGPHVKDRLTSPTIIGVAGPIHVPGADLDWTGAPRIELGYRFPEGFGEFLVSYRSLVSDGRDIIPGYDLDGGFGFLKSRLNVNVVDLDYASREFALAPYWDMKWKIGARLASVYYDSRVSGVFLEDRVSNDFRGAGPHLGLDLWRQLPDLSVSGLAWFGRVESAAVIGKIKQGFEETLFTGTALFGEAETVRQTQAVPTINVQTGFTWAPRGSKHLRFTVGYEYEVWWYLGQVGGSREELTDQGVFIRSEWSF